MMSQLTPPAFDTHSEGSTDTSMELRHARGRDLGTQPPASAGGLMPGLSVDKEISQDLAIPMLTPRRS
jgi:hypothetical protein